MKLYKFENGEVVTKLFLESDVILLTRVLRNFIKTSFDEFDVQAKKSLVNLEQFPEHLIGELFGARTST